MIAWIEKLENHYNDCHHLDKLDKCDAGINDIE